MMNPEQFLSISLLDERMSYFYFGQEAPDGALIFTENFDYRPERLKQRGLSVFRPLGYQKPVDFYIPRYDVDSVWPWPIRRIYVPPFTGIPILNWKLPNLLMSAFLWMMPVTTVLLSWKEYWMMVRCAERRKRSVCGVNSIILKKNKKSSAFFHPFFLKICFSLRKQKRSFLLAGIRYKKMDKWKLKTDNDWKPLLPLKNE